MKKRIISMLLVVVMVFGLMPTVAFMSEATPFAQNYDGTVISKQALLVDATITAEDEVITRAWDGKEYTFEVGVNAFKTNAEVYAFIKARLKAGDDDYFKCPDIIVLALDDANFLIDTASKVYSPAWNIAPMNEMGDMTKVGAAGNGVDWTENPAFAAKSINIIPIFDGDVDGTMAVYGFTFGGKIYPKGVSGWGAGVRSNPELKADIQIVNSVVATNQDVPWDAYYGNAEEQDSLTIKNIYFKTVQARAFCDGPFPANVTIDGMYIDFDKTVKPTANKNNYFKTYSTKEAKFVIKNSNLRGTMAGYGSNPISYFVVSGYAYNGTENKGVVIENNTMAYKDGNGMGMVNFTDGGTNSPRPAMTSTAKGGITSYVVKDNYFDASLGGLPALIYHNFPAAETLEYTGNKVVGFTAGSQFLTANENFVINNNFVTSATSDFENAVGIEVSKGNSYLDFDMKYGYAGVSVNDVEVQGIKEIGDAGIKIFPDGASTEKLTGASFKTPAVDAAVTKTLSKDADFSTTIEEYDLATHNGVANLYLRVAYNEKYYKTYTIEIINTAIESFNDKLVDGITINGVEFTKDDTAVIMPTDAVLYKMGDDAVAYLEFGDSIYRFIVDEENIFSNNGSDITAAEGYENVIFPVGYYGELTLLPEGGNYYGNYFGMDPIDKSGASVDNNFDWALNAAWDYNFDSDVNRIRVPAGASGKFVIDGFTISKDINMAAGTVDDDSIDVTFQNIVHNAPSSDTTAVIYMHSARSVNAGVESDDTATFKNYYVATHTSNQLFHEWNFPHLTIDNMYWNAGISAQKRSLLALFKFNTSTKDKIFTVKNSNIRTSPAHSGWAPLRIDQGNGVDLVVENNIFVVTKGNSAIQFPGAAYAVADTTINNNVFIGLESATPVLGANKPAGTELVADGNTFLGYAANAVSLAGIPLTNTFAAESLDAMKTPDAITGMYVADMGDNDYYLDYARNVKTSKLTGFDGGIGIEAAPYIVSCKEHLDNIRNYPDSYFKLSNDIVFSDDDFEKDGAFYNNGQGFLPIGTEDEPFSGNFDGNGYEIKNLYVNSSSDYAGLFGYSEGIIKNTGVTNSTIIGANNVGAIAGRNDYSVIGCYSNNNHITAPTTSTTYAGGIVGYNDYSIEKCHNTSYVTGYYAGGITGINNDTLSNSYNTGEISGKYVGGIVGINDLGIVELCYSVGTVSGTNVGGIAGCNYDMVEYCYYLDNVSNGVASGYDDAISCTLDELEQISTYNGFDFTNTWEIKDNIYLLPSLKGYKNTALLTNTVEFAGGIGTAEKPYLISNKTHLDNVRKYPDAHYKMTSDVEFVASDFTSSGAFYNGGEGFIPIGSMDQPFTGVFDGNGFEIKNISINSTSDYAGLFVYNKGTIKNVGISGTIKGNWCISAIAVKNDNVIESCYNLATFSYYSYNYNIFIGGIAFYNYGTVSDCYNSAHINGCSSGGVVYENHSVMTGCYNTGNVESSYDAGGVAYTNSGTIKECYNSGMVTGDYCVGGIASYNSGTVSNCYNTGNITGNSTGGIVGEMYNGTVSDCYNSGMVTGDGRVGGIVGYASYYSKIENCYYLDTISKGVGSSSGSQKATKVSSEQLRTQSILAGFDFENIWQYDDTIAYNYPTLKAVAHVDNCNTHEKIHLYDNEYHYDECFTCGVVENKAPHNFENDCDPDCDACDYVKSTTPHNVVKVESRVPTSEQDGCKEYYICNSCGIAYKDADGSVIIENLEEWKNTEGKIEYFAAQNNATGVIYKSFAQALADTKSGETLKLTSDVTAGSVVVLPGVTLDLNGYSLTVDYLVGLFGSQIVDNGATVADTSSGDSRGLAKTGRIYVAKNNVVISKTNSQLPLYDGTNGCYVFIKNTMRDNYIYYDFEKGVYVVTPIIGDSNGIRRGMMKTLLGSGNIADSGFTLNVRVSWETYDNTTGDLQYKATQNYTYNDMLVSNFVNGYGKNGSNYAASLSAVFKGDSLKQADYVYVSTVLVSSTGVEIESSVTTIDSSLLG